ncbi:transposase [Trichonephila clavipes]|nr:transposase [Trichonephila clavipes]
MYRSMKRRRTVCRPSDPPASTLKAELNPKKVLLSVWWDVRAIELEVLPFIINDPFLLFKIKQPALKFGSKMAKSHQSSRCYPPYNNARPHTAVITRQKVMYFGNKVLPPPYFPDLSLSLFHALNNSFSQKFSDDLDIKYSSIQDFLTRNHRNFTMAGFISYQKDSKRS